MPVGRCILPGKKIASLGQFYDEISRQLHFPPHFGRNLDALRDVLTGDIKGPVEIIWEDAQESAARMGDDFNRLVETLRDAEAERYDLTLTLR